AVFTALHGVHLFELRKNVAERLGGFVGCWRFWCGRVRHERYILAADTLQDNIAGVRSRFRLSTKESQRLGSLTVLPVLADSRAASSMRVTVTFESRADRPAGLIFPATTAMR